LLVRARCDFVVAEQPIGAIMNNSAFGLAGARRMGMRATTLVAVAGLSVLCGSSAAGAAGARTAAAHPAADSGSAVIAVFHDTASGNYSGACAQMSELMATYIAGIDNENFPGGCGQALRTLIGDWKVRLGARKFGLARKVWRDVQVVGLKRASTGDCFHTGETGACPAGAVGVRTRLHLGSRSATHAYAVVCADGLCLVDSVSLAEYLTEYAPGSSG
jgi:hypothetical protein